MNAIPDLIVYTRPDCGLCREALQAIGLLLEARRQVGQHVPTLVERDITTNPDWERAFLDTIPVVELGERRLELVTGAARLRRLLAEVLDREPAQTPTEIAASGGG
jgi:hypothetical protein